MENEPGEPRELQLFHQKFGEDEGQAWVCIRENGDAEMAGVDDGPGVEKYFGDDDLEWWVTVPKEHKDSELLRLRQEKYQGDSSCKSGFERWLEEHGIPYDSHIY